MYSTVGGQPPGRVLVVAALAACVLGTPVHAALKDSQKCRDVLAKTFTKVALAGLRAADACHAAKNRAGDPNGSCNVFALPPSDFDPKGRYDAAKVKGAAAIAKGCQPGDPVLGNYVGSNPTAAVYPAIDDMVTGNSLAVMGNADLNADKAKVKCARTIAKARSNNFKEILKTSTKCQRLLDKAATMQSQLAALDPSCVSTAVKAGPKGVAAVTKACAGLTSLDVGSCTPLPSCIEDIATQGAQNLVEDFYQVLPPPPAVCGNGIVEPTSPFTQEQCDDGNLVDGDGCNSLCESEASTCSPLLGSTRTVTVSLDMPTPTTKIAGALVVLNYPKLTTSIPGFGASSVVAPRITVLQAGGITAFADLDSEVRVVKAATQDIFEEGPLFTAVFDQCATLDQNFCNRATNVIGCCPGIDYLACFNQDPVPPGCECTSVYTSPPGPGPTGSIQNPPVCAAGTFPNPDVGTCAGTSSPAAPVGGCPGDNACISPLIATGCTVEAVDRFGEPVEGVECTVSIVENP